MKQLFALFIMLFIAGCADVMENVREINTYCVTAQVPHQKVLDNVYSDGF